MKNSPYIVLLIILFFNGCKSRKESVTPSDFPEKPTIEIVSVQPAIGSDIVCGTTDNRTIKLNSSQVFRLEFVLKAKEGLSQYKIDLHSNFDCHAHRIGFYDNISPAGPNLKTTSTDWKVLKIVDLEGQQKKINEEITVPSEVTAGNYHFMIQCVDAKGNEAEFVIYNLKVTNSGDNQDPTIHMITPASDSIGMNRGDVIEFNANITDNKILEGGRIEITYLNPADTEFTVDQYYFPQGTGTSTNYQYDYTIPTSNFSTGIHTFIIKSYDNAGNTVEKKIKVNVLL